MTAEEWLAAEFSRTWPWLEAALAQQPMKTHDKSHIWEALVSGTAQLWPTPNSAAVTEIKIFPTGVKSLNMWLGGGNLGELQITAKALEQHARSIGCDAATIHGRRGWLRSLDGYQDAGTSMMKDLRS